LKFTAGGFLFLSKFNGISPPDKQINTSWISLLHQRLCIMVFSLTWKGIQFADNLSVLTFFEEADLVNDDLDIIVSTVIITLQLDKSATFLQFIFSLASSRVCQLSLSRKTAVCCIRLSHCNLLYFLVADDLLAVDFSRSTGCINRVLECFYTLISSLQGVTEIFSRRFNS
jgi:hypothetical protein